MGVVIKFLENKKKTLEKIWQVIIKFYSFLKNKSKGPFKFKILLSENKKMVIK